MGCIHIQCSSPSSSSSSSSSSLPNGGHGSHTLAEWAPQKVSNPFPPLGPSEERISVAKEQRARLRTTVLRSAYRA